MSYLLDTCALLWFTQTPSQLSRTAYRAIAETDEVKYFSVVSIWEIAIKVSLKKLRIDGTVEEFARAQLRNAFQILPISLAHTARVAELPWPHRDPFDRMLIAQALAENLEVITADPIFDQYPIGTVW